MTVDLSTYRIASGEKPASATKQNNMLGALENAFNALPPSQLVGYPADATKFLNGFGNWIAPPGLATVYTKTTTTDAVNTVAGTDLFGGAFLIPANALTSSGAIKIAAGGDYLNNTGSNQSFSLQVVLGSTSLWLAPSEAIATSTSRHAWHLSVVIQAMGSTSAQMAGGDFIFSREGAGSSGIGIPADPAGTAGRMLLAPFLSAATSVNMTAAQGLQFVLYHSVANANLSMRCLYARLEVVS